VIRRTLALALLSAVALAAAGCGETTTSVEDFEDAVVTTRERVDFALERITKAQTKEEFLSRMDEAAVAIDAGARDVEETGAAEGFDDEADRLVSGLHALSTDLEATADQIRQPGFENLLSGVRGLSFESWVKVNRALGDLREQGIDVQPLAKH